VGELGGFLAALHSAALASRKRSFRALHCGENLRAPALAFLQRERPRATPLRGGANVLWPRRRG
jgi:hypothetical protein